MKKINNNTEVMSSKNYVLFSTNNSDAIDNVSFNVEGKPDDVRKRVLEVFNHSWFTVSPIGKPQSSISIDELVEKLSTLKFHREVYRPYKKTIEIVDLPDGIQAISECGVSVVRLKTSFSSSDKTLVVKEHGILSKLMDVLGGDISYRKNRTEFTVEGLCGSDNKYRYNRKYAVIDGDLIRRTEIHKKTLEEI